MLSEISRILMPTATHAQSSLTTMEPLPNRTADGVDPDSRNPSHNGVFAFEAPDPHSANVSSPSGDDPAASDRMIDTSGTLSTPYSSSIATSVSYFGSIPVESPRRRQATVSPVSQRPGSVLQTASSRPPFTFLPPTVSNPNSPLSTSKAEVSDIDQEEKSIQ